MKGIDTSFGGGDQRFPDTTWGLISRVGASDPKEQRAGLETLCRRYWKPMYRYLRIAWAKSNEESKDLTQAFLMWLLEGTALQRYEPDRGSFRGYLKMLLGRFVMNQDEATHALKRGGGTKILSLDELASIDAVVADPAVIDPGSAFDRAWAMSAAQAAVERVRERFRADGREIQFQAYELYDLCPGEKPTYASVATRLGIKESDVRNHLFAVRKDVSAELRKEVTQTVSTPKDLAEELDALFGIR